MAAAPIRRAFAAYAQPIIREQGKRCVAARPNSLRQLRNDMPVMSRRSVIAGAAAIAAEIGFGSASGFAMPGPESVMVQVEGVPIHLVRAGRGQPVCLIHG